MTGGRKRGNGGGRGGGAASAVSAGNAALQSSSSLTVFRHWLTDVVSNYFYKHGLFCANHPAPIIFFTAVAVFLCGLPLVTVFLSASQQPLTFTSSPCFPNANLSNEQQRRLDNDKSRAASRQWFLTYPAIRSLPGPSRLFASTERQPEWFVQQESSPAVQQIVVPLPKDTAFDLESLAEALEISLQGSGQARVLSETIRNATSVLSRVLSESNSDDNGRVTCVEANDLDRSGSDILRQLLPTSDCAVIEPSLLSHVSAVTSRHADDPVWMRLLDHLTMSSDVHLAVVMGLVVDSESASRHLTITAFVKGRQKQLSAFTGNLQAVLREAGLASYGLHERASCMHGFYEDGRFTMDMMSIAFSYIVLLLYITFTAAKIDLVKSKWGLAFAAVITVLLSVVISVGLCMRFGLTPSLNAWEVLPYLITIVGFENTMALIKAVTSTPLDRPVNQRIAIGLSKEGVNIAQMLVKICMLISVIFFIMSDDQIQEFCVFALLAVMVDFFLQIFFFATVLSIDIRRLELGDLTSVHECLASADGAARLPHSAPSSSVHPSVSPAVKTVSAPTSLVRPHHHQRAVSAIDRLPRVPRRLRLAHYLFGSRILQHLLMAGTVVYAVSVLVFFDVFMPSPALTNTTTTATSPVHGGSAGALSNTGLLVGLGKGGVGVVGGADNLLPTRVPSAVVGDPLGDVLLRPDGGDARGRSPRVSPVGANGPSTPPLHPSLSKMSAGEVESLLSRLHQHAKDLAHKSWPVVLHHYGISMPNNYITFLPPIVLSPAYTLTDSSSSSSSSSSAVPLHDRPAGPQAPRPPTVAPPAAATPTIVGGGGSSLADQVRSVLRERSLRYFLFLLALLVPCNVLCHCQCVRTYMRQWQRSQYFGQRFKQAPALGDHDLSGVVSRLEGASCDQVECLVADGQVVASCGLGGDIRLWDVVTGNTLSALSAGQQASLPIISEGAVESSGSRSLGAAGSSLLLRRAAEPPLSNPDAVQPISSSSGEGFDFTPFQGTLDPLTSPWSMGETRRHGDLASVFDDLLGFSTSSSSDAKSPSDAAAAAAPPLSAAQRYGSDDTSPVWCMALQGTTVVLGRRSGAVQMYDGCATKLLSSYTDHTSPVSSICYSSEMQRIVAMRLNGKIDFLAVQCQQQSMSVQDRLPFTLQRHTAKHGQLSTLAHNTSATSVSDSSVSSPASSTLSDVFLPTSPMPSVVQSVQTQSSVSVWSTSPHSISSTSPHSASAATAPWAFSPGREPPPPAVSGTAQTAATSSTSDVVLTMATVARPLVPSKSWHGTRDLLSQHGLSSVTNDNDTVLPDQHRHHHHHHQHQQEQQQALQPQDGSSSEHAQRRTYGSMEHLAGGDLPALQRAALPHTPPPASPNVTSSAEPDSSVLAPLHVATVAAGSGERRSSASDFPTTRTYGVAAPFKRQSSSSSDYPSTSSGSVPPSLYSRRCTAAFNRAAATSGSASGSSAPVSYDDTSDLGVWTGDSSNLGVWTADSSTSSLEQQPGREYEHRTTTTVYCLSLVQSLQAHHQAASCLVCHDNLAISAGHDKLVQLYDITKGVCLRTLRGVDSGVTCLALDKKAKVTRGKSFRAVSGSLDGSLCFWQLPETIGCQRCMESAHDSSVQAVDCRGNLAVSAAVDGWFCLWSMESKTLLHRILQTTSFCNDVILFSASLFACTSPDCLRLYDVHSGLLVREISLVNDVDQDPRTFSFIQHLVEASDHWLIASCGSTLKALHFPASLKEE